MCARCTRAVKKRAAAIFLMPIFVVTQMPATSYFERFAFQRAGLSNSANVPFGITGAAAKDAQASPSPAKPQKYTCPMHPHFIADEFGTCPICGMDLVKLNASDTGFSATSTEQRAAITIAPEVIQNMGVRLGKVEKSSFGRHIRSYGIIHVNERKQNELTSRFEGWIERLHVTAVGDRVKAGDRLFEVYSPQLVTSQNDYFLSRSDQRMADRAISQLRSFGVQPEALELISRRTSPLQFVPFFAEQDGTVETLGIRQGSYIKRGTMLVMIQDYTTVWLRAGAAERDLTFISAGSPATVIFPNLANRKVKATVDYIYPNIDAKTRTGQVRLVLANEDGKIRPGTYADVEFEVEAEQRTAIPSEALLRSGQGTYVVVSTGQGRFEPRLVTTGLVSGQWTEITKGVQAGEDVVVSGQFLLDSESSLRESFQKLERLQTPLSLLQLSKSEFAMIDHLIDAGIYLHEALTDGYPVSPQFLDPAISVRAVMWPKFKNTKLAFVLNDAVAALEAAKSAKSESEAGTALAALIAALEPWIMQGAPEHYKARKVALFNDVTSGRSWAQLAGKPLNPYGRGKAEPVAWPAVKPQSTAEPSPKQSLTGAPASNSSMKGSHSGH